MGETVFRQKHISGGLWLGAGILLVAVFLRLFAISIYPPGLHYDEAVNFIVSREIAFESARPFPVFEAFNGREVFYFYVNAFAMQSFGEHVFTMHFTGIMMNILAIAATIGLGQAMFGKPYGRWIGLLAGLFFAVSFPQIFLSRQIFRSISQPLLQALSLWMLFQGLRQQRGRYLWLAGGGIIGGMVLYTYMASRLFPVWAALPLLIIFVVDRRQRRQRLLQGLVFMTALLLVAVPIIDYYVENQAVFQDRLSQLSANEDTPSYAESVQLHAEMFFIQGDPYIRYNEPFAPYFDPLTGLLMVIGLGASIYYILTTEQAVARAAYGLIVVSPLMVIPSVLAVGGLPPSHMRSVGMIPLIYFLPAVGAVFLWQQFIQNRPLPVARPAVITGMALLLGLASWGWLRYEDWASNPELYFQADGDMYDAGAWLADHSDDETIIYITSRHYDHPSLLIHDLPGENVNFLIGERLFLPPPDSDAYFVETRNSPLPDTLSAWRSRMVPVMTGTSPDGTPGFTVYRFQNEPAPAAPTAETTGGLLQFIAADIPSAISGETVSLETLWRIIQSPEYDDLTPLFYLETKSGLVFSRTEPYTLRTQRWQPGSTLIQGAVLDIPHGTPPGNYAVQVRWVARTADEYLLRLDENGRFTGISQTIGSLTVQRPEQFPANDPRRIPVADGTVFEDGIRLSGYAPAPQQIRPGERPGLTLYWQALQAAPNVGQITIRASSSAETFTLWQGHPVMNSYPFSEWEAGELVTDHHYWRVPLDTPVGDYQLHIELNGQQITIGTLTVLAVNRQFEPPEISTPLNLRLGDTVALAGYDVSTLEANPGDSITVTLYWQSLEATDLPLKVFVHLVNPEGFNIDQCDTQPRNYTYPVSLWVPGEYVDDTCVLEVPADTPPGTYSIRTGMYLEESGQRLNIQDAANNSQDDTWTLTEVTIEE